MNIDSKSQLGKLLMEYCGTMSDQHDDYIECYEDCPFLEYEKCPLLSIAERLRDEIIDEIMKE